MYIIKISKYSFILKCFCELKKISSFFKISNQYILKASPSRAIFYPQTASATTASVTTQNKLLNKY